MYLAVCFQSLGSRYCYPSARDMRLDIKLLPPRSPRQLGLLVHLLDLIRRCLWSHKREPPADRHGDLPRHHAVSVVYVDVVIDIVLVVLAADDLSVGTEALVEREVVDIQGLFVGPAGVA